MPDVEFQSLEAAAAGDVLVTRGAVLRCPDQSTQETLFDMMLVECRGEGTGLALMTSTGQKAGIRRLVMPEESFVREPSRSGVSCAWLLRSWTEWIDAKGCAGVLVAPRGYRVDEPGPGR